MNLSKIHHIAIIVSDYEAAKDFYVNKLGFSVIRENYRPERKDWKLDLRVNEHTELEIFAEENPPKRVNRPEACGLRHLAFCVESVEQTVKELAEVGIKCEPIPLRSIEKHRTIKKPSSQPQILFNSPKPPSPHTCHIRKACTSRVQQIKRKSVLEQSGSGDTE